MSTSSLSDQISSLSKTTKLVQGMEYLCYEERLKHLCLMCLDKSRDWNDLLETLKIINCYYDINDELGLFFEIDISGRR